MLICIPPFFLHWRKKWTKMKWLMKGCKGKYALKTRGSNRRDGYLLITQITKPMVAHRADRKRRGSSIQGSLKLGVSLKSKSQSCVCTWRTRLKKSQTYREVAANLAWCLIVHFHPDVPCQEGTVNNAWISKAETDAVIIPSRPFLPWRRHMTQEGRQF